MENFIYMYILAKNIFAEKLQVLECHPLEKMTVLQLYTYEFAFEITVLR